MQQHLQRLSFFAPNPALAVVPADLVADLVGRVELPYIARPPPPALCLMTVVIATTTTTTIVAKRVPQSVPVFLEEFSVRQSTTQ